MANLFKKIYTGTLAKYNALAEKDANSLYMVKDGTTGVKSIYKGADKLAGDFIIVNGVTPVSPEQGVIYYISQYGDGDAKKPFVGFYNGSTWVPMVNSAEIDSLDERITANANAIATLNGDADTEGSVAKAIATEVANRDAAIKSAIEALDVNDEAVEGQFVKGVSEVDGKISVSRDYLADTDIKVVTVAGTAEKPLPSSVKTRYQLQNAQGTKLGEYIDILKDSSVKDVHIGVEGDGEDTQKLYLTYILADGTENEVAVDFSAFTAEAEMGNGLQVDDHIVSVKLADGSETFLSVDEDGVKLSGVAKAIAAASAKATTVVSAAAEIKEGKAQIYVEEVKHNNEGEDGHIEYVVKFQDIASDAALSQEVTDRQSAITNLINSASIGYDTLKGLEDKIKAEASRATGVEGTLGKLTTDANTALVDAINEVDANANAAKAAADDKLASVSATGDGNYISAEFGSIAGDAGAKTQALSVTTTYGTLTVAADGNSVSSENGIAKTQDVATAINGVSVVWYTLD